MKKSLLSMLAVILSAGATMAQDAPQQAAQSVSQEPSKLRLNAGLVFGSKSAIGDDGSETGGIGLNIGGEYFFTEKIAAAPSFSYFFKSSTDNMEVNVSSLNLDGRYYFGGGNVAFYGLAGITVGFAKVSFDYKEYGMSGSASDSKVGVNLGGGLVYPVNEKLGFNAQVTYNTPLEQVVLQAGLSFPLNIN